MSSVKKIIKVGRKVKEVEDVEKVEKVEVKDEVKDEVKEVNEDIEKVDEEEIQEVISDTKYCPSCKKDIEKFLFPKSKNKKGGLDCYCKICSRSKHMKLRIKKNIKLKQNKQLEQANDGEIWKPVVNYELLYECSNLGRIRNLNKKNILNPCLNHSGYLKLILSDNKKRKMFFVHRIIALSFLENAESKPTVNHLNKLRNDNRVCNLEWSTYKEQITHMLKDKKINLYKKRGTSDLTDLKDEIWKVIPEYNKYEISNMGRIKYSIMNKNKRITLGSESGGYMKFTLRQNNKHRITNIHRLVALVFLPNLNNKIIVNHINGNRFDNRLENLEWSTHSENSQHAINTNLHVCRKKIDQYNINGEFIKTWDSMCQAYKTLNLSSYDIKSALQKQKKLAAGFIWKYSNDIHKKNLIETKIKVENILQITNKNPLSNKYITKRKKIIQINPETNKIIKVWDSISEASFYITGKPNSTIYKSLKDNSKISIGFKWKYAE